MIALAAVAAAALGCSKTKAEWPENTRAYSAEELAQTLQTSSAAPTLFVMYASWCGPCQEEMPMLDDVATRYAAKGARVLAVSLDDDPKAFRSDFVDKVKPHFGLARMTTDHEAAVAPLSKVVAFEGNIPFLAVLDRQGHVVRQWNKPPPATKADVEAALDQALSAR